MPSYDWPDSCYATRKWNGQALQVVTSFLSVKSSFIKMSWLFHMAFLSYKYPMFINSPFQLYPAIILDLLVRILTIQSIDGTTITSDRLKIFFRIVIKKLKFLQNLIKR